MRNARVCTHRCIKKAQTSSLFTHNWRPSHCLIVLNKQQETYADMINPNKY